MVLKEDNQIQKIRKLGWKPKIKLVVGLKKYTNYYKTKILPKE